ncbi:MAG: TIGR02757 family protein [Bradymonadaceae bacterium]
MGDFAPEIIKPFLETLLVSCDGEARRAVDPVGFVWDYDDPADREVVALISSCLAYGRVDLLRNAIAQVLAPIGPSPATFLQESSREELSTLHSSFVYRMTRGPDIADLLAGIAKVLHDHGSLEAGYAHGYDDDHLHAASAFVRALRAGRLREELQRGFAYLLPDPAAGSACKRLHLFFRWVVRGPDEVDAGLWERPAPSELRMPLDTHTSRLCRYIGLTARKTADGRAVEEVTQALSRLDPDDPLRYDFALCHLGISGRCIHRRSPLHCPGCPIEHICTL